MNKGGKCLSKKPRSRARERDIKTKNKGNKEGDGRATARKVSGKRIREREK